MSRHLDKQVDEDHPGGDQGTYEETDVQNVDQRMPCEQVQGTILTLMEIVPSDAEASVAMTPRRP